MIPVWYLLQADTKDSNCARSLKVLNFLPTLTIPADLKGNILIDSRPRSAIIDLKHIFIASREERESEMSKKYLEVYQQLKADIYHEYPIGSFLPTEQELMRLYDASRTTIRHAIAMLREERIVDVRQGRGTQVLLEHYSYLGRSLPMFHNVSDITEKFLIGNDSDVVEVHGCIVDTIPAGDTVAAQLQIPVGSMVYRLERIISIMGTPFAVFKNYYRCELVPGLEKYSGREDLLQNVYQFFEKEYNVFFETGRDAISAQLSSFFDSKLLNMKPGLPLLVFRRTAFTTTHETMEYSERLARPDILNIIVTMCGAPHYDDVIIRPERR